MRVQLYLTSKIRLQFPVVVCKDLKAGILVSLQQQQKWGLVLDLPKMQATFKNIGALRLRLGLASVVATASFHS